MNKKSNSSDSKGFKPDPNWPYSPEDPAKDHSSKPKLDIETGLKNSDTLSKISD
ncbi:MAG: hypothetical protein ACM3X7_03930 [Solirubrobacterales bacterium]